MPGTQGQTIAPQRHEPPPIHTDVVHPEPAIRYPKLHLVISGPDRVGVKARMQKQASALGISDRVHWSGLLQGDARSGAIYASEALVLPFHQENFGTTVAEALAGGTPVLISNKVNIWQDISTDQGIIEEKIPSKERIGCCSARCI